MQIPQVKVEQMQSPASGRDVANQFLIHTDDGTFFQSYASIIAFVPNNLLHEDNDSKIVLDKKYWNFSATTSKYRNQFLGNDTADVKRKIKSGEYILENLNRG